MTVAAACNSQVKFQSTHDFDPNFVLFCMKCMLACYFYGSINVQEMTNVNCSTDLCQ